VEPGWLRLLDPGSDRAAFDDEGWWIHERYPQALIPVSVLGFIMGRDRGGPGRCCNTDPRPRHKCTGGTSTVNTAFQNRRLITPSPLTRGRLHETTIAVPVSESAP